MSDDVGRKRNRDGCDENLFLCIVEYDISDIKSKCANIFLNINSAFVVEALLVIRNTL